MIKEALQYLIGLAKVETMAVGEQTYSTKELHLVTEPTPKTLQVTTLSALIDYINSGIDKKASGKLLIHIQSPTSVCLRSELRGTKDREAYIVCEAMLPNNIQYNRFMDTETFNIMLQSSFVENNDKEVLLKVIGNMVDESVKKTSDDGVSQAVTIRQGVKAENILVPNPVVLAPYRTFPEITQPESKFIFRMKEGPSAALYEADGGVWRNESMESIKKYLQEELKQYPYIKIIS